MTDKNLTEIILVVDRSGSMSTIAADMRGGFDSFIKDQRKLPGSCRVTLTRFDSEYEVVYENMALSDVPPLELVPRGTTALLDAVGRTIDTVGARLSKTPESKRPSKVLFVVVTDGHENASHEYTHARIREMIKHQREKYSWEFVFLGASEDAFDVAMSMGISGSNAAVYQHNTVGTAGLWGGLSASTLSYVSGESKSGSLDIQGAYNASVASQGGAVNIAIPGAPGQQAVVQIPQQILVDAIKNGNGN